MTTTANPILSSFDRHPTASDEDIPLQFDAGSRPALRERVASIDAFRGFVMLLMMAEVLRFGEVHKALPGSKTWTLLAHHQSHIEWIGCTLHDLIQPSFSFLVGVALPFSLARRAGLGQSQWVRTVHAFWRSLILVLLGVFLRSQNASQTYWTFEDTLTQIGLGYGFLYVLALCSRRVQWIALATILVGYWLAFALTPLPNADFDWKTAGVTATTPEVLSGFAQHWGKNVNLAWRVDLWFLNLFPRESPFRNNAGGYSTLSFIPTLATMILGLLAGDVIRKEASPWKKVGWLATAGVIGLGAGWLCNALGICPVVKRIWTPSWVLFSGGFCFLFLAAFYLVMDIGRLRLWAFWLTVVGMNSIAAYLLADLFGHFIYNAVDRHLGTRWYAIAPPAYQMLLHGGVVLLIDWIILFWMYRRKLFLRV